MKNPTGTISSEQLRKVESVEPFGHSGAPKIMKKMPHFDHFSRPAEIDPYVFVLNLYFVQNSSNTKRIKVVYITLKSLDLGMILFLAFDNGLTVAG